MLDSVDGFHDVRSQPRVPDGVPRDKILNVELMRVEAVVAWMLLMIMSIA